MSEKFSDNKIVGYLLLFAGLAIIAYSAYNIVQVFTGKQQPIDLFKLSGISIDFGKVADLPTDNTNLKQELISPDLINKPINLIAYFMLMGFLASVGFKIAQLGTFLIRTIKVNVISKNEAEKPVQT